MHQCASLKSDRHSQLTGDLSHDSETLFSAEMKSETLAQLSKHLLR